MCKILCSISQKDMIRPVINWDVTFILKPWERGYDGTIATTNRVARFEVNKSDGNGNEYQICEIDLTNDVDRCSVKLDRYRIYQDYVNNEEFKIPVIGCAPDELYDWLSERCDVIDDMYDIFEETGVVDPQLFYMIMSTAWEEV